MILQVRFLADNGRMDEQYIGEVEEVRFYKESLTFKKNKGETDKGFVHEINYADEKDIEEIYMLNNDGKTIKAVRNIQAL